MRICDPLFDLVLTLHTVDLSILRNVENMDTFGVCFLSRGTVVVLTHDGPQHHLSPYCCAPFLVLVSKVGSPLVADSVPVTDFVRKKKIPWLGYFSHVTDNTDAARASPEW